MHKSRLVISPRYKVGGQTIPPISGLITRLALGLVGENGGPSRFEDTITDECCEETAFSVIGQIALMYLTIRIFFFLIRYHQQAFLVVTESIDDDIELLKMTCGAELALRTTRCVDVSEVVRSMLRVHSCLLRQFVTL